MTTRTILVSAVLALSLVARTGNALLIEEEDAYEVSSQDVILPSENVGNLILKECSACDRVVLRVNAGSRAFIDDEEVSFRDLKKKAASVEKAVYVFYKVESRIVTRVVLDL